MKKTIQASIPEKAQYVSDFSGEPFEYYSPEVEIKFDFGYGSDRDGLPYSLHLTHKEYKELEAFLLSKLTPEAIYEFEIGKI